MKKHKIKEMNESKRCLKKREIKKCLVMMIQMMTKCQNDDSETIKKKNSTFTKT
jgi:hypothetical protein